MPKFTVTVREVHDVTYEVEAKDFDAAIEKATDYDVGNCSERVSSHYNSTLHPSLWSVEDENGNLVKGWS